MEDNSNSSHSHFDENKPPEHSTGGPNALPPNKGTDMKIHTISQINLRKNRIPVQPEKSEAGIKCLNSVL